MLEKNEIEKFVEKIEEIKSKGLNVEIELGSVLSSAEQELDAKSFKQFLKDPKVGYRPTQAKKYIKFHMGLHSQTPDLVKKLGVERYYIISNIENKEIKNNLLSFTNDYGISVRTLNKMVKILGENSTIELSEAYEQAKTTKKEKKEDKENNPDYVSRAEFDELNKKYQIVTEQLETLKQSIKNQTNTAIFKDATNSISKSSPKPLAPRYGIRPLIKPNENIA